MLTIWSKNNLFSNGKGESIEFCYDLASIEMKEENLEALGANMDINIWTACLSRFE